ncbi:hypothetical protein [Halodesulfovibrio sp. MK-HDV]|uniref:hypothetical protein n=1 Tax=Halodesulfovibrio sp. MK-HDV TaxID=2599925 RepID=UPI0013F7C87E|nr:hypothetical protein [Halodesulfovibrio sp. MK-HDV]KAF1076497.1 hypothetical protein MKHDV_01064 [Halodesulfovibrio sp. MK-HDV]
MQKIFLAALLILLMVTAAHASPFTGKHSTGKTTVDQTELQQHKAGFFALQYSKMLRNVNLAQRSLRSKMTTLGREIKKNPNGQAFWSFFTILFSLWNNSRTWAGTWQIHCFFLLSGQKRNVA